jgi:hypothetical protein
MQQEADERGEGQPHQHHGQPLLVGGQPSAAGDLSIVALAPTASQVENGLWRY